MASKLLLQRRLFRFLQLSPPSIHAAPFLSLKASEFMSLYKEIALLPPPSSSRNFCSRSFNLDESQGPLTIDYRISGAGLGFDGGICECSKSVSKNSNAGHVLIPQWFSLLEEGEFHRLADSTIHSLQEKLEEYGDSVEVDGFDIDYGNDVLTVKLGDLGTYVLNKQTPNRQLWLSSPVSGPSRFDWDRDTKAWIYRRNKANLYKILEDELEQLCGKPIVLS